MENQLTIIAVEENGDGGYMVFVSDDLLKELIRNYSYVEESLIDQIELYIDDNPRLVVPPRRLDRCPGSGKSYSRKADQRGPDQRRLESDRRGPGPECCLSVVSHVNLGKKMIFVKHRCFVLDAKGDSETRPIYVIRWREKGFELVSRKCENSR